MRPNPLALAALTGVASLSLAGCTQYGDGYGSSYASGYGAAPDSPWYADQYYRDDTRYHERRLRENDQVYVGRDGRYYCRRSDGTTGLIVGGIASHSGRVPEMTAQVTTGVRSGLSTLGFGGLLLVFLRAYSMGGI